MAIKLPPPPIYDQQTSFGWLDWQRQVQQVVKTTSESLPWTNIDFTGSNLTDILTKEHNALQSTQGGTAGEKYHLTSAQHNLFTNVTTQRLLGRYTAGSGTPEEIIIGSGLTLTGNTLTASGSGTGTVTSVGMTVPTGLSIAGSPITTAGTLALTYTAGYSIPTTASQTNWDTAYTDRNKWDGGATGLTPATGRTSLGGTTVGSNFFTLTNPSAITFPRINADNTVSSLDAATFRTAIGAGTSSTTGTVTSVATSGVITGGTITSTGTIGHSTADGDLHVPATGTTNNGKVLTAGATAGSLSWQTPSVGTTNLAYTASTRVLSSDTGTDATLPLFTSTEAGLTPLSGGGTVNYLRADGTWATPPGAFTESFIARTDTKTMTSNTSLQALFSGVTGATNGALTVTASTSYFFEALVSVSSMSATSGNMGFSLVGAGTATFTSAAWTAHGLDATTQTTAAAIGGSFSATSGATGNIITAATGTAASVYIIGIFRINASGTIIPSIQLTTASAAVIGTNSWFRCRSIGSNTVNVLGSWS